MQPDLLPPARVSGDATVTVRPARVPEERTAALTWLLADTSDAESLAADVRQVVDLADRGELSLDGLLIAIQPSDRTPVDTPPIVAATLVTPGPGGAADLFPPRPGGTSTESGVSAALLAA
ncbi:MAG: hypothetical protein AAF907_02950, partial [Planctomycetota bacterium]